MSHLILAGAGNPTWRKMLVDVRAPAISFEAGDVLRRMGEHYLIEEKVPDEIDVWLDGMVREGDLDLAEQFWNVVIDNEDRITHVIEYAGVAADVRDRLRASLSETIRSKLIPAWLPGDGVEALDDLCAHFNAVAVPRSALRNRRGPAAQLSGWRMRGARVVITGAGLGDLSGGQGDAMLTSSWTMPRRYGEAVVASGQRLRREPAETAEYPPEVIYQALGTDMVDWRNDLDMLCRLAAVTLLKATPEPERPKASASADSGDEAAIDKRSAPTAHLPAIPRESTERLPLVDTSRSLLACDRCTLASHCPEASPGAECAFEFPVSVRGPSDLDTLLSTVVELQAKRTMFNAFSEEIRGGERDPGVGEEMDRLLRMVKAVRDIKDTSSYISFTARQQGGGGAPNVLAQIFGAQAADQMQELDEPIDAAAVLEDVVDSK